MNELVIKFCFRPKKINILFPEMSQYFLGSVGGNFFFSWKFFYIGKSMKIVHNTLKIEEKFSDFPKKFRVGPKKVGSVGLPETRHFFFFWPYKVLSLYFQFNFTCDAKPGNNKYYTTPDNYILITLHKLDHTKLAYNFIFNISLTGKSKI